MNAATKQPVPKTAADVAAALPPGYKRTEVGVIPEDWGVQPCAELSERIMVGIVIRPAQYYVPHGVPAFRSANVRPGGISESDMVFITKASNALLAKSQTRTGDILSVRTGYPGTSAVVRAEHAGCNCIDIIITRPRRSLDSDYLATWINSPFGKEQVLRLQVGLAQKHFNVGDMRNLLVAVPPPPEQRAIAEALSDVDGSLGALEALIAKKRAIKQAAMQQLLTGKTRLPGFTGPWETKRLGDVVDRLVGGGTPSRSNPAFWGGDIPWVTVKDFATFNPQGTQESITRLGLNNSASHLIPAGTLITSTRMALGKAVVFDVDVAINQDLKAVFLRPRTSVRFLFYWFECNARMIDDLGSGSTVKGISIGQLAALPFPSLSFDEQTAIATVLSDMDAEIAVLERRRDKTRAIKQGMMQQLLTGRVRLVKTESEAPVAQAAVDGKAGKSHSWAFNEAIVIAMLAKHFGDEAFPLGRKRYTKLSYLLHRHAERHVEGYLKKAAGPYNPKTKYGGPERIALESNYVREHKNGPYTGFVAADNVDQAEAYFETWYGAETIEWLEQFRFQKNDELELLATVDMAAEELRASGRNVDVATVKDVIGIHPEWEAKLDRSTFSDANIGRAINRASELFGNGGQR